MSNMAYCRFENTLTDLEDCYEHMDDSDYSDSGDAQDREKSCRVSLIELCKRITQEYDYELEA